jgi:glucose/arabinose dehydrogenase
MSNRETRGFMPPPACEVEPRKASNHRFLDNVGVHPTTHRYDMPHSRALLIAAFGASVLSAAMAQDQAPPAIGPSPNLHQPQKNWLPTISWAPVEPWADGRTPRAAPGLAVNAFAQGLKHPRWIYVLPNGDVLVAESATLPSPSWSPRALIQNFIQHRVRATVENANRISLLQDKDGDGVAEERTVFLEGLRQPFGMALIGNKFYVANTDSVVVYPYKDGDTRINAKGQKLMDLKVGHHWTRNLLASRDGSKLYVTVGSASNIAEHGFEIEEGRAAIHELDIATGKSRVFAGGLRNANGMDFEPQTGVLWTVVNERDELGDELPPDYLTSVKDGGFYGWPYSYWGKHVDTRVQPQRPDLVEKSITPDYALGGHTATLGLTFDESSALPAPFKGGAFVGMHGSWNRSEPSGYKVIFVAFKDGRPDGMPVDVLTGFLSDDAKTAYGRPVGVAFDGKGALLVADDAGDTIWRVTGAQSVSSTSK